MMGCPGALVAGGGGLSWGVVVTEGSLSSDTEEKH